MTEPIHRDVIADLGEEVIARIDALATQRGVTRGEVLVTLVHSGLAVEEGALGRSLERGAPTPGQGGERADGERSGTDR